MAFGDLITNKKKDKASIPSGDADTTLQSGLDFLQKFQPHSRGVSPNIMRPQESPQQGLGMLPPLGGMDYGVPDYGELPNLDGGPPLPPQDFGMGTLPPAGNNQYIPQMPGPQVSINSATPEYKKPEPKREGGYFNFTGKDNVFLRGAQGLEDGGILGLIGQILNR